MNANSNGQIYTNYTSRNCIQVVLLEFKNEKESMHIMIQKGCLKCTSKVTEMKL